MGFETPPKVPAERHLLMDHAHPDHAYTLGPHIREADVHEMRLVYEGQHEPSRLLEHSIEVSDEAFVIYDDDGQLHGVWGHGQWTDGAVRAGMGYVWMVSDDELFSDFALLMTRKARNVIFPYLDTLYPLYGNFVHSKNLLHCRWLLGARFRNVSQATFSNEPFSLYLRTTND